MRQNHSATLAPNVVFAFLGLPTDSLLGTTTSEYARKLRDRLQSAYKVARDNASRASSTNKARYDQRAKAAALIPGDRVLVRALAFTGTHKLCDRWEDTPYIVIRQPDPDTPVFEVRKRGYTIEEDSNPSSEPLATVHGHQRCCG